MKRAVALGGRLVVEVHWVTGTSLGECQHMGLLFVPHCFNLNYILFRLGTSLHDLT